MIYWSRLLCLLCLLISLAGCAAVSDTASATGDVIDAGTSLIP
ncbi:hypothetical protein RIE95_00770 [Acidithiobacillus thiooxidans]|jgi:hypothetical protein|uniref:Lipoprotein n=1 Tax=Acidithiobacillus thiooxidans ATCC 19377 TaxID=637390 RepID=A0A543Q4G8_ACITH|nr:MULTISPECIES: hypothetical protein [Acidithiobacillus]MDA8177809.1 hypothetical protein [Acidithiobacillus sp.]MDR7925543.1 hypothetical protein [Acidithiobacillus thiooxidans]TQN51214.1 hypothetical protein DLNHIDIE_01082 [Acidithiobacillus thiooxidans ATCC 19377]